MSWRSTLAALGGLAFAPTSALAVDSGRLGLLSKETADVFMPAGRGASVGLIVLMIAGALVASLVGTWIGLRSHSVARIRDRQGWRELTYRFRTPGPLKVDGDLVGRMAGVLDDLEDLGRRFKSASIPAAANGAGAWTGAAMAESSPVRFARSHDTEHVRARWIPPGASESAARVVPPAPVTLPAPRHQAPLATEETRVEGGRDRASTYRAARRLLESGHDRDEVRRRTGLKLAEIDLLRCAPRGKP